MPIRETRTSYLIGSCTKSSGKMLCGEYSIARGIVKSIFVYYYNSSSLPD